MGGQSTSSNSQNEVQADIITLVPIQIPSIHRDQSEQSDQRNRAATTSTTVEPLPLDTLPDTMTRSLEDQHRPTATQTDNSTLLSALTNDHIASPKFNPNQYDSARNANPIPLEIPSSLRARVSRSSSWPATNGKEIEFIAVREGLSRSRSLIIEGRGVEVYVTSCIPSKTDDDAVRIEIPSLTEQPTIIITPEPLSSPQPLAEKRKRYPDELDRTANAIKKLKLPFRSPMTRNNLHNYLGLDHPANKHTTTPAAASPDNRPFSSFKDRKPPTLQTRNIASTRSSKPFKSPFASSDTVLAITPSAEVTALERHLQILNQAHRVSEHSDERLEELIIQWREAGRVVVERVFAIMPEPSREEGTKAPDDVLGVDDAQWHYGKMMMTLQVDPGLLGWDDEIADWACE